MPNAYKRQLKDKNQDYIYPVLDPADLSGKLDKVSTAGKYQLYAMQNGNQGMATYSGGADAWSIPERQANGTFKVGEPTDDAHPATKKYVDDTANFTAGEGLSLSGKTFSKKPSIYSFGGTSGTAGYVKIAKITITGGYANTPFSIEFCRRSDYMSTKLSIKFASTSGTNPALDTFNIEGATNNVYIDNSNTSIWDIYVAKTEGWDATQILDYQLPSYLGGKLKLEWIGNEQASAVGSTWRQATRLNQTTKTVTSGTQIATITQDGRDTNIFAPDVSGKLNVSGNNATQAGVEALINKLPTATGTPNDNTYYTCQNNDGTNTYYRRTHGGLWNYIKSKITGTASLVTTSMITDKNVTTAKLADKAVTPAKIDFTTRPIWSTFVIQQGADNTAGIDYTTLRGTAVKISRRSGGTWCSVVSGGANINVVKQTVTARFSSTLTGAFGAGNIKTGSKVYSYWAGASNGAYENKGVTYTAGSSDDFADAMITTGNKGATSIVLTATRLNTTLWSIHAEIQSSGSATSLFLNTEVTTADANHIPTLYQRSATSSNTSFCRNVIELLEE